MYWIHAKRIWIVGVTHGILTINSEKLTNKSPSNHKPTRVASTFRGSQSTNLNQLIESTSSYHWPTIPKSHFKRKHILQFAIESIDLGYPHPTYLVCSTTWCFFHSLTNRCRSVAELESTAFLSSLHISTMHSMCLRLYLHLPRSPYLLFNWVIHTVDGRNPAPVRAYFTIPHDFYPRTPCSMLCSQALCAGAGYQSFNFFAFVTNISYQC